MGGQESFSLGANLIIFLIESMFQDEQFLIEQKMKWTNVSRE